jgi:hypothetical protein
MKSTQKIEHLLAYCIIPFWLFAMCFLPYIALAFHQILPRQIGNLIFFAPQYLFSFLYIVKPLEHGFDRLFSNYGAIIFGFALWPTVTIAIGLLGKYWRARYLFFVGPFVIAITTLVVHSMFSLFGYQLQLDGP